jgi:hypothetical protein
MHRKKIELLSASLYIIQENNSYFLLFKIYECKCLFCGTLDSLSQRITSRSRFASLKQSTNNEHIPQVSNETYRIHLTISKQINFIKKLKILRCSKAIQVDAQMPIF